MFSVNGTYKYGRMTLREEIKPEKLDINKFSFKKARKLLESYKVLLSDVIIEERRSAYDSIS